MLLWAIWFGRNEGVFQCALPTASQIVTIARRHINDYREATIKRPVPLCRSGDECWKPAAVGWFKINTDALCQQGSGAGLGGVLCDDLGQLCWVFAKDVEETMSIEIAEARAILFGVECSLKENVAKVIVEVDSKIVCFALMRKDVNLSHFWGGCGRYFGSLQRL